MQGLKKFFKKVFILIVLIGCIMGVFLYWGWFEKQYNKCIGMYYVYKGDKAYKHNQLQEAIDDYNRGLVLYPEHYRAWFNLGNIYVVYEDYNEAADSYDKAIHYNPHFTLARMNLGIISTEKLGDFDEAISQYQQIIDNKSILWFIPFIFDNSTSAKINRGLAYYNMGVAYREKSLYQNRAKENSSDYLQKAIQAYKNAAKILKKDYDTRYNLAIAYHLAGDYQDAGLTYCKAIELEPMNYEAHYNLAILLRHLKMYPQSLDELEKANMLIANSDNSTNTTSYVFDILNDVSSSLLKTGQYKYIIEKLDKEQSDEQVTYVNGKIVATDALDRAILKNLRTCSTENFFKNYK